MTEYSIAETYQNALYEGHTCHRYWLPGDFSIMVGGSLLGPGDWDHLHRDFGITHVVNVETEHDDRGKLPDVNLCQVQVPDDGTPFPADKVLAACLFVSEKLLRVAGTGEEPKFYVHCQMGGSRSPGFAYAIMRSAFGLSASQALAAIRSTLRSEYGNHHYHQAYMMSVEAALAPVLGGR